MNNLILLLITSVSVWRVSNLINNEDGPFHIFEKIREAVGLTKVEDLPLNEQIAYPDKEFIHDGNVLAEMIECMWCLSIWVGSVFALYLALTKNIKKSFIPLFIFASSAITIFIKERKIIGE
jgi:hypothetical protein